MNYMEITFQNMMRAFLRQWKCIVIFTVVFVLIGACTGMIYADSFSAKADGSAESCQLLDFSDAERSISYYDDCYSRLLTAYKNTNTYVSVLAAEATATQEQETILAEFQAQLEDFEVQTLQDIMLAYAGTGAVYVPEGFHEEAIRYYTAKLEETHLEVIVLQESLETLLQTGSDQELEKLVSEKTAEYENARRMEETYKSFLEKLTEDPETVYAESLNMEAALNAAAQQINALIVQVDDFAAQMAVDNHLRVLISYGADDAVNVLIQHTHGERTQREGFLVITLFCTLVGICFGAFFAICRDCCGFRFLGKPRKGNVSKE